VPERARRFSRLTRGNLQHHRSVIRFGRTGRNILRTRSIPVEVLLGKGGVDLAHHRHRIGQHVEKGGAGTHALDQPVCPERDLLDIGRHRQRGEDDLGLRIASETEATLLAGRELVRDKICFQ